jgi:hypothetical protein
VINPLTRGREKITGEKCKYENLELAPKEHGRWILLDRTGDDTKFTIEMKAWQLDKFWMTH